MNHYVDIRITPNAEFSDDMLMNELFFRLHKVLTSHGRGEIGISFPNFNKTLGDILRLHGARISLQRLMSTQWTDRMIDYIKVSGMNHIPEIVNYRVVKRIQTKSSPERLMRRSIRKGWITEEEAALKIREKSSKQLTLPFIQLKSLSTQQTFRLFVEHGPILIESVIGTFNAYGLSSNATVPWF